MIYDFNQIEEAARGKWAQGQVYRTETDPAKPKYYVLDMFPYPSGAGLHVGHPLGYIFSDIYSRYKRMKGFNVLHPMGFDAFGLPAEQYAIQTGQHPAVTTAKNIETFKAQLDKIGFSYDWSREVSTCDPKYYTWTQWIFLQLFESWFNTETQKAEDIATLVQRFETSGNIGLKAACDDKVQAFDAAAWQGYSALEKQDILMSYRLAYRSESFVNWCPGLGTVLANDEVVNGVSERGGFPVEKKKMSQWFLRITAYADRLLQGLETLDWTESIKDQQRNWIGRSTGAMVSFPLDGHDDTIDVFTTRVDTIFGVTFLVIAPEHELVQRITTNEYKPAVEAYVKQVASKSDIERQQEKTVSGQFTGAHVLHPFTGMKVPVFIADYVLAGYGTGAVMAVPSGDQRDYLFAEKFGLEKPAILDAQQNLEKEADPTKEGKYINSDFINGLAYAEATALVIQKLEEKGLGYGKIQYRMRDAGYSRQRYWGEPFPIYYDADGLIHTIDELPVELPEVSSYKPTGTGESPLANATDWVERMGAGTRMETDTMPGYAGSSWYFLRYMDPQNDNEFCSKAAADYWENVDFYVGGSEHAVGHLLYSRFWHKFLKDKGLVKTEEPFKKMVNQGMIQGVSALISKDRNKNVFVSEGKQIDYLKDIVLSKENDSIFNSKFNSRLDQSIKTYSKSELDKSGSDYLEYLKLDIARDEMVFGIHVDISLVKNGQLDVIAFKKSRVDYANAEFICESDGSFICSREVEKMSKSKFNVVNPDEIINQYGADCFRMYEMFLGPIDTAKPWDTNGISGVANFLRKFWRLFFDEEGKPKYSTEPATDEELKIVHKCIKKVGEDIERHSFNTCVSSFMIAVNDYGKIKQPSLEALELLIKLICPFAPHTAEVLWDKLGKPGYALNAEFPVHEEKYLVEDSISYPVQVNGKLRANVAAARTATPAEVEAAVLSNEQVAKYFEGKTPKKIIVVPGRIVNIVV